MSSKFSVIIPTHNRVNDGLLRRAMLSVLNQTYGDFECIVVDDASDEPIEEAVRVISDGRFRLVSLEKRGERLRAWNAGFKAARGEWICMLCSDDVYLPHYLQVLDQATRVYPGAKVFNFQELNIRGDARIWIRALFAPRRLEKGHEPFCSGKISTGNFVFKRECLGVVGMFPEVSNYWKFADAWKERYPWIREHCYKGELGNPYGEDFALFYAITREFHSTPLPCVLMAKYPCKGRSIKFDEFERRRLSKESSGGKRSSVEH